MMEEIDISKISTADLLMELKKREVKYVRDDKKDRLKTKWENNFAYDVYKITKVVETNKFNRNPRVGELHRCVVNDVVGLISMEERLRGYYYIVEGEKVQDRDSWEDYILNLDPNTIVSEDVPYWEEFYQELQKKGVGG